MLSTASKIRIARLLYWFLHTTRRLFGASDEVTVRRRGVAWSLDLREGIDLTIYVLGAFELDTLRALESLVKEGDVVLDVGANVGAHTLHLARLVGPQGRVIAFEPTDFAMAKLRANLDLNPELQKRVVAHQAFLVGKTGAPMDSVVASSWPVDGRRADDALMGSRSMGVSGARALTVDDVLAASGDPQVRLIKMDVDGHELEVLEGAKRLLEQRKAVIVMELAPYVFHPPEKFEAMVDLLARTGYVLRLLGSASELPADGPALRALIPREGSMNVLAIPGSPATPR
jgi:FkbM family methyltransferase